MKKDEYIASAVSKISNRKAKRETERELGEHIDELTEFYLGRNMTADEAEERAVSDMGAPNDVASLLGRLHRGAGKIVFVILIAVMLLFAYLEVCGIVSIDLFSGSVFITEDLSVEMSNRLYLLNGILVHTVLLLLTCIGFFWKKSVLRVVLGMELYLSLRAAFWLILFFDAYYLQFFAVPFSLFVGTLILIIILEREDALIDGDGLKGRIGSCFGIAVATVVILFIVSIFIGNAALELVYQYEQDHTVPVTLESYVSELNLPDTVADESMLDGFCTEDFGELKEIPNYASWNFDETVLSPDYKLPDNFNNESEQYYIDSRHPDFLFCVRYEPYGEHYDSFWRIRCDYQYPDLESDEVCKVSILGYDTTPGLDLTDAFMNDNYTAIRQTANRGPSGDYIYLGGFEKHLTYEKVPFYAGIQWYFTDYEGIYLKKGDLHIDDDNHCFISPQVITTYNANNYQGEEGLLSYGEMYQLGSESSKKINELIDSNNESALVKRIKGVFVS